MKRFNSALIVIFGMTTAASAQIAMEAGGNASNMSITQGDTKMQTGLKAGGEVGVLVDLAMSDHVFFEPGIFYQTAGCNLTGTPTGYYMISTLTMPISIEYKSGEKCSSRFMAGIGPYICDNLSGTYSIDPYGMIQGQSGSLVIGTGDAASLKGLDIGAAVNVGYQIRKHFYFRLRYQMGFTNLYPGSASGSSIKTMAICATVGFSLANCSQRGYSIGRGGGNHWRGVKKGKWSTKQRNYHERWLF